MVKILSEKRTVSGDGAAVIRQDIMIIYAAQSADVLQLTNALQASLRK